MKTTYELKAEATCPVDGKTIDYRIAVTVERPGKAMIFVEDLIATVGDIAREPTTQEDMTKALAERLPGAAILTVGTHSGVRVTCEASAGERDGRSE